MSFAWTNDRRVVYTLGNELHIAGPTLDRDVVVRTFEDEPREPALSPDGRQIAFVLVSESNFAASHGTVWTMAPDGSDLVRVVAGAGDDDPVVAHPTWSPDGEWLLVEHGDVTGANSLNPGLPGAFYAIPNGAQDVVLGADDRARVVQCQERDSDAADLSPRCDGGGLLSWVDAL